MSEFDYARTRATAERLIKRFGQVVTLTQTANSGTAYNPSQTETDHSCYGAVLAYAENEIDGTLIKNTDKQVYLSTEGLSVTPAVADKITVDGISHEIINLMPLSPAGTVVFWKVQIRK